MAQTVSQPAVCANGLRASTCFEHYLLSLRRHCTNSTWYTVCVLRQLAAPGLGGGLSPTPQSFISKKKLYWQSELYWVIDMCTAKPLFTIGVNFKLHNE
jgi:hypothetical protein